MRDLAGWQSWLRAVAGDDVAEYQDFGGGVYRAASFAGDRLDTCLFVGPARDAGDWNVVKDLFAADALDRRSSGACCCRANRWMASPMPARSFAPASASAARTICDAIAAGANSAAAIGAQLKAGTNCGSCIPELKRLIAQGPAAAEPRKLEQAAG